ncbi:MAG TPA: CoA pyrophosphatase [Edaphocola sp.]|nr:CoA pyrophosphatase [Edaphocola sp.]
MYQKNWNIWKETLVNALTEPLPGLEAHKRMLPSNRAESTLEIDENAKQSAVMIILFPNELNNLSVVLIERTQDGGKHSGQIAFPGGKMELSDRTLLDAALRETEEEVFLQKFSLEILGKLSPLYIKVSNFLVQPFIAYCAHLPQLKKSDKEVHQIYLSNLSLLLQSKAVVPIPALATIWQAPVYKLPNDANVWGATAMILSELEMVLERSKLI